VESTAVRGGSIGLRFDQIVEHSRLKWLESRLHLVALHRGGTSLYFRDPDGHLLELATPGLWTIY
jgi:catechol 2,3-dioxygenase-like lactoylglutathione lyase family enzyme